ncbi:MAG: hypothetical protein UZ10_BCD003000120 [Bacteroidetes bacterium OLB10]|nr:MAG: hypothetical protein UZ10_BCD003000120 [Bacteroidetes bacterium OLB10]
MILFMFVNQYKSNKLHRFYRVSNLENAYVINITVLTQQS